MDNCVKTTTPLSSFSSVQSNLSMAISSPSSAPFLDSLFYCEEQDHPWNYDHNEEHEQDLHLPTINHQDFFWEDEELVHLFTKEQLQTLHSTFTFDHFARKDAVDWILKVKSHFGFTHLTAILAINYLDRFLSSLHFQQDKPWMIQLLAVTSLSLAAKVEETQVPSLLDLQVEDTKYMFEPKNIQKMELLMMSALEWKMNPVTPISFLDHIVRRLGLKTHLHSIFVKKCEDLILFLVSDSRFVGHQPSVLATAAMLHVIDQVDYFNSVDYQNQLLEVLKTTKEKVKECNEMIMDASHISSLNLKKRKFEEDETMHIISSSSSHHYHRQPPLKKTGIVQQQLGYGSLSCKVPVDLAYIP
ncbi:putative cyclin domain-containing protein [Helianthus debilis subsp. tardiflorus]